jgi:hypothetical protein
MTEAVMNVSKKRLTRTINYIKNRQDLYVAKEYHLNINEIENFVNETIKLIEWNKETQMFKYDSMETIHNSLLDKYIYIYKMMIYNLTGQTLYL